MKLFGINLLKNKYQINSSYSTGNLLTLDSMNAAVKKIDYALVGSLYARAVELQKELREKVIGLLNILAA